MFITDNWATVVRILIIFSAVQTPMKFQFWKNGEKISPLASLHARARKLRITRKEDFGLFFPQKCFVFCERNFFLWWKTLETFRGLPALLGEHLSQKLPHRPIKPFGKIFQPPQKIENIFFLLGVTRAWRIYLFLYLLRKFVWHHTSLNFVHIINHRIWE